MTAPEGMIAAEEFAKSKGYSLDETIGMIRSGYYDGRLVDGQWYVREKNASEDRKPYSPTSPEIDDSHPLQQVVVRDIHMTFGAMVAFMVKGALASIPALIILVIIFAIVFAIFAGIVGEMMP